MGRFAENTNVSKSQSLQEIEATLRRYRADAFQYSWSNDKVIIQFLLSHRAVKFAIKIPSREDFEMTETGRERKESQITNEWEKAIRQRYRALLLIIKAKLEAVESGISTFDIEFLPHIVLPGGVTVAEHIIPSIENVYKENDIKLLPAI